MRRESQRVLSPMRPHVFSTRVAGTPWDVLACHARAFLFLGLFLNLDWGLELRKINLVHTSPVHPAFCRDLGADVREERLSCRCQPEMMWRWGRFNEPRSREPLYGLRALGIFGSPSGKPIFASLTLLNLY